MGSAGVRGGYCGSGSKNGESAGVPDRNIYSTDRWSYFLFDAEKAVRQGRRVIEEAGGGGALGRRILISNRRVHRPGGFACYNVSLVQDQGMFLVRSPVFFA